MNASNCNCICILLAVWGMLENLCVGAELLFVTYGNLNMATAMAHCIEENIQFTYILPGKLNSTKYAYIWIA